MRKAEVIDGLRLRTSLVGCLLFAAVGCGGAAHRTDGAVDGGHVDGPARDAPPPDAADAAAPDAAVRDAAMQPDLQTPDSGGLPVGAPCDNSGDGGAASACEPGLLCCVPCCDRSPAVCMRPAENDAGIGIGQCPLPDLTIDPMRLRNEVLVDQDTFAAAGCSSVEGCVEAPGTRLLLHFTVTTPNIGTADLRLGDPSLNPSLFVWSPCHGHYHFSGYALYRLLELGTGREILRGRKRAFCLEDYELMSNPPLGPAAAAQFTCANQGISMGWADSYVATLSCQFLDVTRVPPGNYMLEVTVNPERVLPELRYDNNVAAVPVTIPPTPGLTDACLGTIANATRDCGWTVGGMFACTPGTSVLVGCGATCGAGGGALGACTGDTILRVCDGTMPCSSAQSLAQNDDCNAGTTCSAATFTCPASGRYTVLYAPYTSGDVFSCTLAHVP